jgi:surface carbohydrate biosynthesis protein
MRIALVVDNPRRDLRGLVLVAHELLKRGTEVYLVPMYQQGCDLPLIAPDAVLMNYVRPNNRALLETYHALGVRVMVLDTEGGVLSESGADAPANWARSFHESGLDRCVDHYFFWGTRLREAFAAAGALAPQALEVTGCPRYDFCHPRWRALLQYPRSGFILVNTNFSALNPRFTGSARAESGLFEDAGWQQAYTATLFAELEAAFARYLDALEGLARRNAHRELVVRPHPFEDPALYSRRFANAANVTVDPAGDVLNAISHADCVVHLNCGTAVETLLLGKVPISLEFLNTPAMRAHAPMPSAISCHALSEADLDRLVNDPTERDRRWERAGRLESEVQPWFHVIDGEASRRVARGMEGALARLGGCARRSYGASLRSGVAAPRLAQRAQGLACNIAGSRMIAAARAGIEPARADKRFNAGEVAGLLERLRAVDPDRIAAADVRHALHPLSGAPLVTLRLTAGPGA